MAFKTRIWFSVTGIPITSSSRKPFPAVSISFRWSPETAPWWQAAVFPSTNGPTTLVVEHNADLGEVTLTYGGDAPATYTDPGLIMTGTASVGAGSNNDAFAIDDFTITQIPEPGSVTLLALSALTLCRRNRKNS